MFECVAIRLAVLHVFHHHVYLMSNIVAGTRFSCVIATQAVRSKPIFSRFGHLFLPTANQQTQPAKPAATCRPASQPTSLSQRASPTQPCHRQPLHPTWQPFAGGGSVSYRKKWLLTGGRAPRLACAKNNGFYRVYKMCVSHGTCFKNEAKYG